MTKQEFENWKSHTELSKVDWMLDPIHNGCDRMDFLFYRGGMDGQYVNVRDGLVQIGQYVGALPHVGEALFEPVYSKQFKNNTKALRCLINNAGFKFINKLVH